MSGFDNNNLWITASLDGGAFSLDGGGDSALRDDGEAEAVGLAGVDEDLAALAGHALQFYFIDVFHNYLASSPVVWVDCSVAGICSSFFLREAA